MRRLDKIFKICPECKTLYSGSARFCPKDGAALEAASKGTVRLYDPYVGTVQDQRLKIEATMAEDGLTVLYAARHLILDRRVAVKVLRSEYASDRLLVERFLMQARRAAKLDHPNLGKVLDSGRFEDGAPFFVVEFLGTRTLRVLMDQEGPLSWQRSVALAIQVCAGLEHAHLAGVVHGNLNPDVLVLMPGTSDQDRVKVTGFGTSEVSLTSRRATKTGFLVGVPEYMSPEQAAGRPTGPWTDIYSISVILFEMITGRVPFESDSFMGALGKHMVEPVPDLLEVAAQQQAPVPPAWLGQVIAKGLAKEPRDRFETMEEMLEALAASGPDAGMVKEEMPAQPSVDEKAPTQVYLAVEDSPEPPEDALVAGEGIVELQASQGGDQAAAEFAVEPGQASDGPGPSGHGGGRAVRKGLPWSQRMVSVEQVVWAATALVIGLVIGLTIVYLETKSCGSTAARRSGPSQVAAPARPSPGEDREHKLARSAARSGVPNRSGLVDLTVETCPAGAEVELDGRLLGVTPLEISLPKRSGNHVLTARLAGYEPYRTEVTLTQALRIRIQLTRPGTNRAVRSEMRHNKGTAIRSNARMPDALRGGMTPPLLAPGRPGPHSTKNAGELKDPFMK